MSNAKRSLGTTLQIGVTTVGELTEIMAPELTAEEIDVTTLGSTGGYREYIQGFLDSGSLDITGFFYPGDAGQAALLAAYEAGTVATFTITYPSSVGATWTFQGFLTKFKGGDSTIEDPLAFEATIRITGASDLGTTASTGMSAFILRDSTDNADLTNDTYTPTFAIDKYFYTVTYDTNTSFRVKATAASHTIHLYVDGVYTAALTSATAGAAISQSAGTTKELKLVVWEAAKTPKTYTFMVSRTA